MTEEKMCRYGCGVKIKWVPEHKMPIEVDYVRGGSEPVEHTFKRCADIQKAQGREPFFYDRSKRGGR